MCYFIPTNPFRKIAGEISDFGFEFITKNRKSQSKIKKSYYKRRNADG